MIGRYCWRGGEEHYLRFGEGAAITLLVLPALFEEANRMRRFTVSLMRALADRGIGTILPDLPGTGESSIEIGDASLEDWKSAIVSVAELADKPFKTISIRGGAIFDDIADAGWRLAPENGQRMLRDMVRATTLSQNMTASALDALARTQPTRLAGNVLPPDLYAALTNASPATGRYRTVRLKDDAADCDIRLTGTKLWRAAEPGEDTVLVNAAAADIVAWIDTCAA